MAKKRGKRGRKLLILAVIVFGLVALGLAAFMKKREVILAVETEKVSRRDITETVVANGQIQPVVKVNISAEVSGEIIELPVKEGQRVVKGDLLVRIKPDLYVANVNSSEASYKSALSRLALSEANLRKAELEFKRNEQLFEANLISEVEQLAFKTNFEIAQAEAESAQHQIGVAKAALERVKEELSKTAIYSPLDGTISKLNSEAGERVVGTAMMTGTEIMTVADLNEMEARVDIGEIDIVLVKLGQTAKLEVDAFRDIEFKGTVTEIANSSKYAAGGQSQEATKFEVKIRVDDRESFRPGMSVTAEIQTRSHTNVIAVPVQSVTTRLPKPPKDAETKPKDGLELAAGSADSTNSMDASENPEVEGDSSDSEIEPEPTVTEAAAESDSKAAQTNDIDASVKTTDGGASEGKSADKEKKEKEERAKPIEVVFVIEDGQAKMVPVKRGISDDSHTEIVEGLEEGQEVVIGGYRVISRDLEDGKKVRVAGTPSKKTEEK